MSQVSLGYAWLWVENRQPARSKQDGHGTVKRRNSPCGRGAEHTRSTKLANYHARGLLRVTTWFPHGYRCSIF